MKNLLTLFAVFAFTTGSLQAQIGASYSIKGGPQRTDMRCDRFITENRTGYTAGICAAYGVTNHVTIGIDALYSSEGRRMLFQSQTEEQDFRERIGYLKLPIHLAYTLRPGKTISFTTRLGPQLSLLLHGEGLDRTNHTVMFSDTRAAYNKVNLGAMAGFDINARVSRAISLSVGLRADMTFTDTEKASLYVPGLNDSYTRNINVAALLGVSYHSVRKVKQPATAAGS